MEPQKNAQFQQKGEDIDEFIMTNEVAHTRNHSVEGKGTPDVLIMPRNQSNGGAAVSMNETIVHGKGEKVVGYNQQ